MNKSEFVAAVADAAKMSKAEGERAVDAFIDVVARQLKKGGEIRLVGFGTFEVRQRQASEGRNPRTGETIKIKASRLPRFKAGKALKDEVNGNIAKRAAAAAAAAQGGGTPQGQPGTGTQGTGTQGRY